jgi:hypothetical protein
MRRAVGAEAHHALNLEGADTLLVGQHQMRDPEPLTKRLVCVLKDGASDVREAVERLGRAFVALPLEPARHLGDLSIAAARAFNASGPTARDQISLAGFLIRESLLELRDRHLMRWFRAFQGCHDASPQ